MKRITYWALSTLSALVLVFGYHTSTSSQAVASETTISSSATGSATSPSTGTSSGATSSPTSTPTSTSSSTASSSSSSSTTSGTSTSTATTTVTGTAAATRYGPVQVKLTITAGKVTAVDVVEYPSSNGRDEEINAQALPILVSETLKAQSANIDMVSGATYTSTGYTTSLQSALDEAGL